MSDTTHATPIAAPLVRVFAAFGRFFEALAVSTTVARSYESRMRQIEQLNALPDAELAKLGLTRDRIVHHVFRDLYYV